ncbi:hypothetical protein F4801DRAFT_578010 [Xylaria longipes]|nr:hypothetical protein F4801DRAFT_578010 [Xylaria longipes]
MSARASSTAPQTEILRKASAQDLYNCCCMKTDPEWNPKLASPFSADAQSNALSDDSLWILLPPELQKQDITSNTLERQTKKITNAVQLLDIGLYHYYILNGTRSYFAYALPRLDEIIANRLAPEECCSYGVCLNNVVVAMSVDDALEMKGSALRYSDPRVPRAESRLWQLIDQLRRR